MPKARKQKTSTARSASRSNPLSTSNANAKKEESSESPRSGKRGRHGRESDRQRALKEEDRNDVALDSAHCVKAEGRDESCFGLAAEVKVERKRRSAQSGEKSVKDEDGSEDSPKLEQDEGRERDMLPKLEDGVKTERKDEGVTKQEPGSIKSEQHDRTTGELTKGGLSNYLIQACISSSRDPTVTRLLSVPPDLTFDKLHEVLQVAFGWANCHPHRFDITDIRDNPWYPARLLSVYRDPIPLHDEFASDDQKESEWTLADVYEKPEWKDRAQIEYEYDLGDGWHHILALLGRATPGTHAQFGVPDDAKVVCLGGQGHAVAEDCGGSAGWEELKKAFRNPRRAANRDRVEWYKYGCANGDPGGLDPYKWDILDTNEALREAGFFGGQAL
ncbi:MAG: hypothetical protein HETSPECPRED_003661 [Heterodermia speciosa]|uniref:Plasmid pRiA4b Orf3-like domain-containing protein n=1 Tax=Heterodermia speciosa TaxID=116794 RepID=A0A8H3F5L8_9LECA|nr:MAG: hypothetical protein HETSPECPRED_003661 [Heterodermia speciosa]